MPRNARLTTPTGMYHVMMRGANKQKIFLDDEDRYKFLVMLYSAVTNPVNQSGRNAAVFNIYAYALMGNHIHIFVKVISGELGELIKKVAASYVKYFNKKYERDGHLFKERFKSEICEDKYYFETLLRYIHQNPIKAGICTDLLNYKYTSWNEYADPSSAPFKICNTKYVLNQISLDKLKKLILEPLPDNQKCIDEDKSHGQISDKSIEDRVKEKYNLSEVVTAKDIDPMLRKDIIFDLLDYGAGICQISRITGISKSVISKLRKSSSKG